MGFGPQAWARVVLAAALIVPASASLATEEPAPDRFSGTSCGDYTVRPGDTLSSIVADLGSPELMIEDMLDANPQVLADPDLIRAGQVLVIPCHVGAWFVPDLPEREDPQMFSAPAWSAEPGDGLVAVLADWGQAAGFEVIVERSGDWRFGVPFHHTGSFREAVDLALSGFSTAASAPYVTFYTNNVMTIGAR